MKKLAILLVLSAGFVFAQSTVATRIVDADPSGACVGKSDNQLNERNGKLWGCVDSTGIGYGTWTLLSSTGGVADPGANGPMKRTALNVTAPETSADVIGLFTGCSGTQYLGADGACHAAGAGTGGSMFTGSIATSTTGIGGTASAPTVNLADQGSTQSPHIFEMPVLSANVTSVTVLNPSKGADFWLMWTQAASTTQYSVGGYVNQSSKGLVCDTATLAFGKTMFQHVLIAADGTSLYGVGCSSNDPADTPPVSAALTKTNANGQSLAATASDIATVNYVAGSGTAQAQTATYAFTPALTDGTELWWKPSNANTGAAPTFSPNGLAAHAVVKVGGGALVAGDLSTTAVAHVVYDTTGTQWELQNPQTSSGGGSGSSITQGAYSALPGTCTTNDLYLFTSGLLRDARCSGTNTWSTFYDGHIITPAAALTGLASNLQTSVTESHTNGYSHLVAQASSSSTLSWVAWTAPFPSFTKYVYLRVPAITDPVTSRDWAVGLANSSDVQVYLYCGANNSGVAGAYSCDVRTGTSGAFSAEILAFSAAIPETMFFGDLIIGLTNDNTNISISITTDGDTGGSLILSEACTVHFANCAAVTKLFVGALNSASGRGNLAVDLIGVN